MADEQVRIDVVADDHASKTIDKVADKIDDLEHPVDIPIEADTADAERDVQGLLRKVDGLAKDPATLLLTSNAADIAGDIADLVLDLDKLDANDPSIDIKTGQINALQGDLDAVEAKLRDVAGTAETTARRMDDVTHPSGGPGPRANAIADLTGPLGDVSSQASDLAGVFDGMGDILEGLAPKMGISADKMVGAIGGIGFAITAAATVWGFFQQEQKKAEEHQKKLIENQRKLQELLEDQKFEEAAQTLVDGYDDAFDAAEKAKIPIKEVVDFLAGYSDVLPTAEAKLADLAVSTDDATVATADLLNQYAQLVAPIITARGEINTANDSIKEQDDRLSDVSDALQGTRQDADDVKAAEERLEAQTKKTSEAFDRLRGSVNLDQEMLRVETAIQTAMDNSAQGVSLTAEEVLDLKSDIIGLAETAEANPAEVKSTLDKIDRGDLAGVKADAESYYARAPVEVTGKITVTNLVDAAKKAGSALTFGFGGTSATVVNVTQHIPRGWRGDALADAQRVARRSGGLYRRSHR